MSCLLFHQVILAVRRELREAIVCMEPRKKMPEAEVSLRLAFCIIEKGLAASDVDVAIDGAQVKTSGTIHFAIIEFLRDNGWRKNEGAENSWQGVYFHNLYNHNIRIHSKPGQGDVVSKLLTGRTLRVECKKGPLVRSKSSQEYPLLREALGQLLTIESIGDDDLLAVAVPKSQKFDELTQRWRKAPLILRFGICLLTVDENNQVSGLPINKIAEPGA